MKTGTAKEALQRGFGLSTSTYVVIASMIGTGILVSPGYMMASIRNYPLIFGLWALGGLLALCGALCVVELAAALPRAGGEYVYLREAYGPMPAFKQWPKPSAYSLGSILAGIPVYYVWSFVRRR